MDDWSDFACGWWNVDFESVSFKGNKSYLPKKMCATCMKEFTWRKKWEKNWAEVKYCSDRCRKNKHE